jgi:hypothetical protein
MAPARTRSGTNAKAATRSKAQGAGTKGGRKPAASGRARSARKPAAQRSATAQRSMSPARAGASRRPAPKASPKDRASNGHAGIDAAKNAVANVANDAGHGLRRVTRNAKTPLLASGAALAGAAGGVALGATRRAAKLANSKARPRVRVQINSQDIARTAREIGSFGEQLGMVATELGRAREAAAASKHRSPIEVVLQGLTTRR